MLDCAIAREISGRHGFQGISLKVAYISKGQVMKRAVFIAILLFFATRAYSQGVGDSLIVNLKNGQRVAIPLSEVRKITFDTSSSGVGRSA